MANESLAVSSPHGNLVSEIAYLIETSLQERCDFSPDDHPYADYRRELATLMGLGFTVILAEGSRIRSCRSHFAAFLRYRDFIQHSDKLPQLSIIIAEIIYSAIYAFKMLGFPLYYDSFVQALVRLLQSHGLANAEKEKKIKKLIQQLFEMCG